MANLSHLLLADVYGLFMYPPVPSVLLYVIGMLLFELMHLCFEHGKRRDVSRLSCEVMCLPAGHWH